MRSKLLDKLLKALMFSRRGPNQKDRALKFGVGMYKDLTSTQAGRLVELQPEDYTLNEACEHLNVSEQQLLHMGSTGTLLFFVSALGLRGYWRQAATGDRSEEKSYVSLTSGFLALPSRSVREIEIHGSTNTSILELRKCVDCPTVSLKPQKSQKFTEPWPDGEVLFCLQEPVLTQSRDVILMNPLPDIRRHDTFAGKVGRRFL